MRPLQFRRLLASVIGAVLVASSGPLVVSATAASPIKLSDFRVAHPSDEQQAEMQTLRRALAERGISDAGIGVFALPTLDGMTTIITRTPDEFVVAAISGSLYELTRVESPDPAPPLTFPIGVRAMAADGPRWSEAGGDCDIYSTEGFARTQCFEFVRQANDKDRGQDFYQYTAEATGHSKGGREMNKIWVERKPAPGSAQQEFDGIPEPKEARNKAENCVQTTEGISVQSGAPVQVGLTKSWSRMTCETYRPQMYEDEGHWATIWEGNPEVGSKNMRHVMFTMPVRTPEGGVPKWLRLNGQRTTR